MASWLVADHLSSTIRNLIPFTRTWISDEDIAPGSMWFQEICKQLHRSQVGIFVVTRENLDSQWIHFEIGNIARRRGISRAIPFLVDISPSELRGPIAQFQALRANEQGLYRLIETILTCAPPWTKLTRKRLLLRLDSSQAKLGEILEQASLWLDPQLSSRKVELTKSDYEILGEGIKWIYENRKEEFLETGDLVLFEDSLFQGEFNEKTPFGFEAYIEALNFCLKYPNSL